MLAADFLRWWYGKGLKWLLGGLRGRISSLTQMFSVPLLLRTLFAPWRQIISYGGGSIGDRARALLDNVISRLVGAGVRVLVIITASLSVAVLAIVGGTLVILWPFLPLIALGLIIRGLIP